MDQTALVDEQIEDGKRLLERLAEAGFAVTAAGWVKESERDRWYLYLVSPLVEEQGIRTAYGRIHPLVRQMPQPFEVGPFDVKAVGPREPMAEAILDLHRRQRGRSPLRYGSFPFAHLNIEGVYLYPLAAAAEHTDGKAPSAK
jgi:hypothetical protein